MVFKEVHGFELQGTDRKNPEMAPYTHPLSFCVIIALHLLLRVWTLLSEDEAISLHGELGTLGKGVSRT